MLVYVDYSLYICFSNNNKYQYYGSNFNSVGHTENNEPSINSKQLQPGLQAF